ncbi:hypothetical protein FQZ97_962620 [compost metagenome]
MSAESPAVASRNAAAVRPTSSAARCRLVTSGASGASSLDTRSDVRSTPTALWFTDRADAPTASMASRVATSERCNSLASGSMRWSMREDMRLSDAVRAPRSSRACLSCGPDTMARADDAMAARSSAMARKSMPSSCSRRFWMAVTVVGISVTPW